MLEGSLGGGTAPRPLRVCSFPLPLGARGPPCAHGARADGALRVRSFARGRVGFGGPVGLRGEGWGPLGPSWLLHGPVLRGAGGCSQNGLWAVQAACGGGVRRPCKQAARSGVPGAACTGCRPCKSPQRACKSPQQPCKSPQQSCKGAACGAAGVRRARGTQRALSSGHASGVRAAAVCEQRAGSSVQAAACCTRGPAAAPAPLQPPLPSVRSRQIASGT